ncbi:MAG: thiamine diphosphokinase [Bacillota bacterium]
MKKTLIVLNGVNIENKKEFFRLIESYNNIIAVDGGYKFFKKITKKEPDTIIGDFDSLQRDSKMLKDFDGEIFEFSSDKDKTDGELAIDYCKNNNIKNISIIGATGGRIDQQYGNIILLDYALINGINAKIIEPGLQVGIVDKTKIIKNKKGYTLSIFSLTEDTIINKLSGFKYELDNYTLKRESSRGISNVIIEDKALIDVGEGKLLFFICQKC